jgi:hypothetical protein
MPDYSRTSPEQLSLPLDGVVRIPLHSEKYPGLFALIDAEDYERVSQHRWYPRRHHSGTFYAATSIYRRKVTMHRFLMDAPDGVPVDHANHSTLDNRRIANLRLATESQQQANRVMRKDSSSPYKGVRQRLSDNCWQARLTSEWKTRHLGYYMTAEDAAVAYDQAVWAIHGAFALLNFPDSPQKPAPRKRDRTWGRPMSSGYRGVWYIPAKNKWRAEIRVNRKQIFLGHFATPEEANAAIEKARLS